MAKESNRIISWSKAKRSAGVVHVLGVRRAGSDTYLTTRSSSAPVRMRKESCIINSKPLCIKGELEGRGEKGKHGKHGIGCKR
jgi:hypothetical protein